MAKIQYIKDKENVTVYPVTHERAVRDSNNVTLDTKLNGKQDALVSGTNIKTVNGESLLGSGNITAGDPDAIKYTTQSLTSEQKAQARTNIGAASSSDLSGKQNTLVSGTNIKTVGGESLLGSGNIPVGETNAVKFTEQTLTASQKTQAKTNIGVVEISSITATRQDGSFDIALSNGNTITVDLNHTHSEFYVKAAGTSQPSGGFLPDVVYILGTVTGTVTFSLASAVNGNINHYFWTFTTGSSAPTITWPSGITWSAGDAPEIGTNKTYEISILNNIALYTET